MRSVLQTIYPFSFSNLFLDIAWILSLNANPIAKDILFKIVLCFNRIKSSLEYILLNITAAHEQSRKE